MTLTKEYSIIYYVSQWTGYGNQSPVSRGGRELVSGLGWLTIVIFGGLSVVGGNVMGVMFDDFFRKIKLKSLTRASSGVIIWACISAGWTLFLGVLADNWWKKRIPDDDTTINDSLWFAYISATTVGLGDYYLVSIQMVMG